MTLYPQKIEALLFYEGGTMSKKALRAALGTTSETGEQVALAEGELVQALLALKDGLKGRGVELYESSTDVSLRANPELAAFLADYEQKSLSENVGAAAIEVLAVLLYRGPSTQADIDSIRGVNSAISLRTLRMRGLVTKDEIEDGGSSRAQARRGLYSLTSDALAHLGVTSEGNVPEREEIRTKLAAFEEKAKQDTQA
jgi:segregation and condensation protein B